MKKGRFLWSAHRITERQKAGKARSIKGKQLKNSRNTVSKQLVALRSSPSAKISPRNFKTPEGFPSGAFFYLCSLFSETPERTHTEFSFSSAHRSAAYPFINYFLIWFTNHFKTRYETVNFVTFSVCCPVFAHFLHRLTGNFSFLFAVFLVYLFYMSTDGTAVSPLFDAGIAPGENAFPGG